MQCDRLLQKRLQLPNTGGGGSISQGRLIFSIFVENYYTLNTEKVQGYNAFEIKEFLCLVKD